MVDGKNQKISEQDVLAGAFVEIALTNEQVMEAISEEERLGIREGACDFFGGKSVVPATLATIVEGEK